MKGYAYTSEQAKQVTICSVEEAKKIIIATATARELSMVELLIDKDIADVVNHFSINLNDLSIEINPDPNDFTYTYSFK